MNSEQPNEPSKQLSLWEEFVEKSQNIPRDDSARASIEKSALDENHALMEEIVDETIIEMAWTRVKANRGAPGPDGISIEDVSRVVSATVGNSSPATPRWNVSPRTGTTRFYRQSRWRHARARHSKLARPFDTDRYRFSPYTDLRPELFGFEFRLPIVSLGSRCSQAGASDHSRRSPPVRRYGSFKIL